MWKSFRSMDTSGTTDTFVNVLLRAMQVTDRVQNTKSLDLSLWVSQLPVDEYALVESTYTTGICLQSLSETLQCHLRATLGTNSNTNMITAFKPQSILLFYALWVVSVYHMGEAGTWEEVCVCYESSGSRQGRGSLQRWKGTPTFIQPFCTFIKQSDKSKTHSFLIIRSHLIGQENNTECL